MCLRGHSYSSVIAVTQEWVPGATGAHWRELLKLPGHTSYGFLLPQDMVLEGHLLGGQWWTRVGKRPERAMHPGAAACYHGVLFSGEG